MCDSDGASKPAEGYGAHRGRRETESQLCLEWQERLVGFSGCIAPEGNVGVARQTTSVSGFQGALCVETGGPARQRSGADGNLRG